MSTGNCRGITHTPLVAALVVALLAGLGAVSSPAVAATKTPTTVVLDLPNAGDVSYGVAQVRVNKAAGRIRKGGKNFVLAQAVGGLNVDVRSPAWQSVKRTTKVYVLASRVNKANPALRNVAFFITRQAGGKGPKTGKVTFKIANASAVVQSFWVQKVDRRGNATIFQVRNILSTAVGNWTRYLTVLKIRSAFRAALNPIDTKGRFSATQSAAAGPIATGGNKMSKSADAMFRLVFGTIGDPRSYQAAKRSPLVPAFIATELKNKTLAARWAQIAGKLPLLIPDTYAAAAKQEATFTKIARPSISWRQVVITDLSNSSQHAAIESPRLPADRTPGTRINVVLRGNGAGLVTTTDGALFCPPVCSIVSQEKQTILNSAPAKDSVIVGIQGCDGGIGRSGGRTCAVNAADRQSRTVIVGFNRLSFGVAPPPPPPPPTPTPTPPPPSSLDSTFGSGGFTLTPFTRAGSPASGFANAMAAQPDGKLLLVGLRDSPTGLGWAVARYDSNGKLDPEFDSDGIVDRDETGQQSGGRDVIAEANGPIDVTGETTDLNAPVKVWQLSSTGSPTAYGTGGIASIPVPGATRTVGQALALQPDGKLIVVGSTTIGNVGQVFAARFNLNGTPDAAFDGGGDGVVLVPATSCGGSISSNCEVTGVAIQTAGTSLTAIYFSAYTYSPIVGGRVFKLIPGSGQDSLALDPAYGDTVNSPGVARFTSAQLVFPYEVILQSGGRVIVGGESSDSPKNQCGITLLQANGQPDPAFGNSGFGKASLPDGCSAVGLAQQPDGKVVFAGSTLLFSLQDRPVLGRFNASGTPDTTFVAGGVTKVTPAGDVYSGLNDVHLQGAKIVAAGGAKPPPHEFLIARYNGGG